jgi:hypothetical protein
LEARSLNARADTLLAAAKKKCRPPLFAWAAQEEKRASTSYEHSAMQRCRSLIRYALCAPWDLLVLVLSPLLCLAGTKPPQLRKGVFWLEVREGSFIHQRWRYSTTLGRVVLIQPGLIDTDIATHELVHVRQYEGAVCSIWLGLAAFTLGNLLTLWLGLLLVALIAPWWGYAGASLAAFLRDERPYLDNEFERHARAEVQTLGQV